jgi:hypothetical protein
MTGVIADNHLLGGALTLPHGAPWAAISSWADLRRRDPERLGAVPAQAPVNRVGKAKRAHRNSRVVAAGTLCLAR